MVKSSENLEVLHALDEDHILFILVCQCKHVLRKLGGDFPYFDKNSLFFSLYVSILA